MESSIAAFLIRQLAFELLPIKQVLLGWIGLIWLGHQAF